MRWLFLLILGSFMFRAAAAGSQVRDSVLLIESSVMKIPEYAFADRKDIVEVLFPENISLTEIGDYAFLGCTNLRRIKLPSTVTILGEGAFRECSALEYMELPDAIRKLPRYLFAACKSLGCVKLPPRLQDIAAHAFVYCENLAEIDIPGTVSHIGSNAFSRCLNLKEVKLPSSITELESYAFSDCIALTKAQLPANGKLLGELIFSGCANLRQLTINYSVPPRFDCNSFIFEPDDTESYMRCSLLVPRNSVNRYSKAPGWKLFKNILPCR